jgi:plastocyanin
VVTRAVLALVLVAVGAAAIGAAIVAGDGGDSPVTRATIGVAYSRFETEQITVPAGTPITFTLENGDPIEHEWIVGPVAVHERHRTGTEPYHDEVPTEVTLPAYATRVTTITFDVPGEYQYICHLPGHEAYGMVGTVNVVAP